MEATHLFGAVGFEIVVEVSDPLLFQLQGIRKLAVRLLVRIQIAIYFSDERRGEQSARLAMSLQYIKGKKDGEPHRKHVWCTQESQECLKGAGCLSSKSLVT